MKQSPQKHSVINNFISRNARQQNSNSAANTSDGLNKTDNLKIKRNSAAVNDQTLSRIPFLHDEKLGSLSSPNNTQPLPKHLIEEARQAAEMASKLSQTNQLHWPNPNSK